MNKEDYKQLIKIVEDKKKELLKNEPNKMVKGIIYKYDDLLLRLYAKYAYELEK